MEGNPGSPGMARDQGEMRGRPVPFEPSISASPSIAFSLFSCAKARLGVFKEVLGTYLYYDEPRQ